MLKELLAQRRQLNKQIRKAALNEAANFLSDAKSKVTGGISKGLSAIKEGAKTVGKGGFAVAGLAVGGAIKGGQLIGKGVVNGAKAVAKVPGQVASVFKSGATKVAEVATKGFSKAKGLLGKLKDGIAGKAQAVGRTVRNGIEVTKVAASKAKSFVANGANTAIMGGKNLAKNIVQGIANGSRAAAGAIRSAGKAVANSQMVKTTQRYAQTGAQIYMANKARAMQ